jgi:molybdopterin adenylyltransferase
VAGQVNEGGWGRRVALVTVSDRVAGGTREDKSGDVVAARLVELGFAVDRSLVPDEVDRIQGAIRAGAADHEVVMTTGGTGLTPRDVTPQATLPLLDYEIPGMAELMRSEGAKSTPLAYLSRSVVGVMGRCLVVTLPGSTRGAIESLEALVPILDHALDTLAGPFEHGGSGGERAGSGMRSGKG